MTSRINWSEILSISANLPATITVISPEVAVFLQALSAWYNSRYLWTADGAEVTDEQWDAIQALTANMENSLMSPLVGIILPNVLKSLAGLPVLPCDGQSYARAEYPLLYDALASAYIVDANNFIVPDLRDKFIRGSSASSPIASAIGEDTVTLTVSEMPSHTHTNPPHTHTEITATPSVTSISPGAPQPTALPGVGLTGASSITISDAGGGQAHNNIPASISVDYVIVAG